MLPYLLLFFISTAAAANCSYKFDGRPYSRTSVLMIKGLPTNLAYDPVRGDLFFTLVDLETLLNDDKETEMDQYVLRDGKPIKFADVNGQAAAVDSKTGKVYIASDNGINILNGTDTTSFLSLQGEDIVQMFKPAHKNVLYVVDFPENVVSIFDLDKNEKTKVDHVPCAFILAVDSKENIYYECDSKYVKVLLKDFSEPIEFAGIGKNMARALGVDSNDRVILATNDGLYHLRPDNLIPKKLMNLDFVPSGITFNGNDMYISTTGIIYGFSAKEC
ncbi:hypothetical protein NE865_04463 [Phthorimaea operculella]|nr:hypothetical protein NE865_04463 [Phthorimaea operculella]